MFCRGTEIHYKKLEKGYLKLQKVIQVTAVEEKSLIWEYQLKLTVRTKMDEAL